MGFKRRFKWWYCRFIQQFDVGPAQVDRECWKYKPAPRGEKPDG